MTKYYDTKYIDSLFSIDKHHRFLVSIYQLISYFCINIYFQIKINQNNYELH